MPRVFISYSHDSAEHIERVLQLANSLRRHGVDAELDRYHASPPSGWLVWYEQQLSAEKSEFVLMVCTEAYLHQVEQRTQTLEGSGVCLESHIVHDYLYRSQDASRFIPVLLAGASADFVPIPVRNRAGYHIDTTDFTDNGFENLCRELTGGYGFTQRSLRPVVGLPVLPVVDATPSSALHLKDRDSPFSAPSRLFPGRSKGPELLIGREKELADLDFSWIGECKKNIITIVAFGGTGKTSLVASWAAAKLALPDHGGIERYFDWSFYSQGTRPEGDAKGSAKAAAADLFIREALNFFGDPDLAASNASAWEKGCRLVQLITRKRSLLVLDGLEPLQDAKSGVLRDEGVRALLLGLAADNPGLCLVTTRQHVPDLNRWHQNRAPEWQLSKLSKAAGARLLHELGVKGTVGEREQLAEDVKGHTLTLSLLGKYLSEAHEGDITRRDHVSLTDADYEETSGHAFRVVEAYEKWFEKDGLGAELAILRLLGLFDRPASPDCLSTLRTAAIPGLTDALASLSQAHWNLAVNRLVRFGLVEKQPWEPQSTYGFCEEEAELARQGGKLGEPRRFAFDYSTGAIRHSIDAHPLIRQFFADQLQRTSKTLWKAAHSRLFEHLLASVPHWPDGFDGLQPLFQAINHGCSAGRHADALMQVYRRRIVRGVDSMRNRHVGASNQFIACLSNFFEQPWDKLVNLQDNHQLAFAWHEAGHYLFVLGRLTDAAKPLEEAVIAHRANEEIEEATEISRILGERHLMRGRIPDALAVTRDAIEWAGRGPKVPFALIPATASLARIHHHAGDWLSAWQQFTAAEEELRRRFPERRAMISYGGFWFCDYLLDLLSKWGLQRHQLHEITGKSQDQLIAMITSNLREMMRNARLEQADEPAMSRRQIDVALTLLIRTRLQLRDGLQGDATRQSALLHDLNMAVDGLRQTGQQHHLVVGLLTRAGFNGLLPHDAEAVRKDLDEAWQIAERAPMPLFQCDIHLCRARLLGDEEGLKNARTLIEQHGYWRRKEELLAAEKAIKSTSKDDSFIRGAVRTAHRTIVELDLVGYSAVCYSLQQGLDANAAFQLNAQIQTFIEAGLRAVNASRELNVIATTGDGAILVFESAEDAHGFAEAVHEATRKHNQTRELPLSKRVFRCGAATGEIIIQPKIGGGFHIAGYTIVVAVRLEVQAEPGSLLVDEATYLELSHGQRTRYSGKITVQGKHGEVFDAYSCKLNLDADHDAAFFREKRAKEIEKQDKTIPLLIDGNVLWMDSLRESALHDLPNAVTPPAKSREQPLNTVSLQVAISAFLVSQLGDEPWRVVGAQIANFLLRAPNQEIDFADFTAIAAEFGCSFTDLHKAVEILSHPQLGFLKRSFRRVHGNEKEDIHPAELLAKARLAFLGQDELSEPWQEWSRNVHVVWRLQKTRSPLA